MKNFLGKEMLDISDWVRKNFINLHFRRAYADIYWDENKKPMSGWFSVTLTGIKSSELAMSSFQCSENISIEDWFGNPRSLNDRHFLMMIVIDNGTREIVKKIATHYNVLDDFFHWI